MVGTDDRIEEIMQTKTIRNSKDKFWGIFKPKGGICLDDGPVMVTIAGVIFQDGCHCKTSWLNELLSSGSSRRHNCCCTFSSFSPDTGTYFKVVEFFSGIFSKVLNCHVCFFVFVQYIRLVYVYIYKIY
jgi:hypothetical protein